MKPERRRFLLQAAGGGLLAASADRAAGAAAPVAPQYCFFSKHLPDLDWNDLAAATIDMGFDAIDLTVRAKGHVLPERVVDDLPRAADAIRARGTTIGMITTEVTAASQPAAAAIFATAARIGVPLIKVGYWKYTLADVRAEVAAMGRDLAGLAALAQQHRVTLGVHNHQGYIGGALWDIAPHVERLDARAIGYYFDPRHAVVEGGGGTWKAATQLVSSRLRMIAVKDAFWEKGPRGWEIRNCPMGEGMVDWPWFAAAMAKAAFAGPISVHLEYPVAGDTPAARRASTMAAALRDLAFARRVFAEARG
jgi:sugar phosphate isomerase/epimerase